MSGTQPPAWPEENKPPSQTDLPNRRASPMPPLVCTSSFSLDCSFKPEFSFMRPTPGETSENHELAVLALFVPF